MIMWLVHFVRSMRMRVVSVVVIVVILVLIGEAILLKRPLLIELSVCVGALYWFVFEVTAIILSFHTWKRNHEAIQERIAWIRYHLSTPDSQESIRSRFLQVNRRTKPRDAKPCNLITSKCTNQPNSASKFSSDLKIRCLNVTFNVVYGVGCKNGGYRGTTIRHIINRFYRPHGFLNFYGRCLTWFLSGACVPLKTPIFIL